MADDREQRVRQRAYEIWEKEGRRSGRERDHWEQAEREIGGEVRPVRTPAVKESGEGKPKRAKGEEKAPKKPAAGGDKPKKGRAKKT